jgi:single-stranded DNA-binding protein
MLHCLVLGTLISDPVRRTTKTGNPFGTGTLRVATEDGESVLASIAAFGDMAQPLLAHHQGSTLSVAGKARLTSWTGKDGAEKHGISITVTELASAAAARRADAERRKGASS